MTRKESAKNIEIVDYSPVYKKAFKELNEEWIRKYFKMEAADHKSLDHPEKNIIDKGGYIKIALYNSEAVGVCALVPMENSGYDYELAKMAVSPKAQGLGIGWLLGQAVIEQAKKSGAKKIFLESNTVLTPAINLYKKMGFVKIEGFESPYERSNIQMEYLIEN
ncbi:MAG: GNAT family N-acetyltransferase [Bacteroidota bacterium]